MDAFDYRGSVLCVEDVSIERLAERFGTPCYIYSTAALQRQYRAFSDPLQAVPHQICYAVKANSNLAILRLLAQLGSGFDVVSVGELKRVLAAGGQANKTIFSGVGKSVDDIRYALTMGIQCINIESEAEFIRVADMAADLGVVAPIAIRVNPDVDAHTHPYIATGLKENKFGVEMALAESMCRSAQENEHLRLLGVGCHIGSQLLSVAPFVEAVDRVMGLYQRLVRDGIPVTHFDVGGGLGVSYQDEQPPTPDQYCREIVTRMSATHLPVRPILMLEPGRAIAAQAGILVTRVEYIKSTSEKNFVIVDAAMNDLLRPSLYSAWQRIIPVNMGCKGCVLAADIVGPVCETGDFLGKGRDIVAQQGSLLAVKAAGAYGFSMSSNYNTRNRAAEVLVDGDQVMLIRQRETFEDQVRLECAQAERLTSACL